jgi:hypothetical protein
MRNTQISGADFRAVIEQNIEIEGARAVSDTSEIATEFCFDLLEELQKSIWRDASLDLINSLTSMHAL